MIAASKILYLCQLSRLEQLVPEKRREVAEFRKAHNDTKIGEVNVGMVCYNIFIVFLGVAPHT